MLVHVPQFSTDAKAETFLDQDLTGLDFSQFKSVRFACASQVEQVALSLRQDPLDAVKGPAAEFDRTDSSAGN